MIVSFSMSNNKLSSFLGGSISEYGDQIQSHTTNGTTEPNMAKDFIRFTSYVQGESSSCAFSQFPTAFTENIAEMAFASVTLREEK